MPHHQLQATYLLPHAMLHQLQLLLSIPVAIEGDVLGHSHRTLYTMGLFSLIGPFAMPGGSLRFPSQISKLIEAAPLATHSDQASCELRAGNWQWIALQRAFALPCLFARSSFSTLAGWHKWPECSLSDGTCVFALCVLRFCMEHLHRLPS